MTDVRARIRRILLLLFAAWMVCQWVGCEPVEPFPLILQEDRPPTLKNIDWQIHDAEVEGPLWRDTQRPRNPQSADLPVKGGE